MVSTGSRSGALLALAIVASLGAGILLGFLLDDESPTSPNDRDGTTAQSPSGPGPYGEVNDVPVGYAQTEEGAVAAATNFGLISTDDRHWSQEALGEAMAVLAAPSWKEQARRQGLNGYRFVRRRYGPDADVSGAALRYRLLQFSPDQAVVKLWIVTVISGSERDTVDEVWGTATVEVRWINGDWRVEGTQNETGPAPVSLPQGTPTDDAHQLIEDLHEYSGAPTP